MDIHKARLLAVEKMKFHNLTDWNFRFDNAKRRFGLCAYKSKMISLSESLTELNPEEEVLNTILHEIAHALVGRGKGHTQVWKLKALEIGCNG